MLRVLLLVGIPILAVVLIFIFAGQSGRPAPPTAVYYNGTHLFIDNAKSLEYGGKTYGPGNYAIRVGNDTLIRLVLNGRPVAYKVGYAYRQLYYDGVKGVAMVYVQNLGNVTLSFMGVAVQTVGSVELPASAVQVEPPSVSVRVAPERCTPQACTAWIHVTVNAPYPGRFLVYVGGQRVEVEVNRTGFAQVEAPYGYRVPVELRPWFYDLVRVAPAINASMQPGPVLCAQEGCTYSVKLSVWAEVPTVFSVYHQGRAYTVSIPSRNGTATLQLQLPPGTSCVSVVPPARDVCIDLPDRPARLVVESIQWYYYSHSSIIAVLTLYNPGLHRYVSDLICSNCGPPSQDELAAVLQTYYGVAPIGRTVQIAPASRVQVAMRVGTAGGTLVLENGSRIELRPPPMPAVRCNYVADERPGSGGLQPFPSWAITKHIYVVINFSAPNIYYQNFVRAYAGNYSMPVSCSGQVCTAVVPVEAILVDRANPTVLLGWHYLGNRTDVAVPATAYVKTPWCTIKLR